MKRSLPLVYLALNVTCAMAVLYAAHRVSAFIAAEQRDYSDSVDGITFFASSAPAFALALLANIAWLGKTAVDILRRRNYQALAWLGASATVWISAIVMARLF